LFLTPAVILETPRSVSFSLSKNLQVPLDLFLLGETIERLSQHLAAAKLLKACGHLLCGRRRPLNLITVLMLVVMRSRELRKYEPVCGMVTETG
jgi:hypothetical protein